MAILAFSSDDPNGSRPIAAHPAFPAIVAMWFAVLLGLGTLALPAALIERLAPAMTPPFGMSARTLIAVAAATIGALAGFAAARRIAASAAGLSMTGGGERAIRPLSAHEELGELLDWAEVVSPDPKDFADEPDVLPAWKEDTSESSDLAQLVERLGLAIERHRELAVNTDRSALAFGSEPASIGYVSGDTEAALRSALARLRQLRGAV